MRYNRRDRGLHDSPAHRSVDNALHELQSRTAGWDDAIEVAHGERVVRAILAHFAAPTFDLIWRDLDREQFLIGYRSAPGSQPPSDRRRPESGSHDGPLRRSTDGT